jgi:hypothetical protein
MEMPPPGWYQDPVESADLLRWWDGSQWTAETAEADNAGPDAAAHGDSADATAGVAPVDDTADLTPVDDTPHSAVVTEAAPPVTEAPYGAPVDEPAYPPAVETAGVVPSVGSEAARPGGPDEMSLTEWFQGIPIPGLAAVQAGEAAEPGAGLPLPEAGGWTPDRPGNALTPYAADAAPAHPGAPATDYPGDPATARPRDLVTGRPAEALMPAPSDALVAAPGDALMRPAADALMPGASPTSDGLPPVPGPPRDNPTHVLGPPGDNPTHVLELERAPWDHSPSSGEQATVGTLASTSWQRNGELADAPVRPIWEQGGGAPPPRRNRTRLMWALALGAAVAVLITGGLVAVLGSPAGHTTPAAAAQHPPAVGKLSPSPSPSPSDPSPAPTTGTPVADAASGLTYATLGSPWQAGCPTLLSNPAFTWTAGESAVAGTVGSGVNSAWYGSACSGPLGQQYPYNGVADLEQTAQNLVNAFDPAYYNGLQHTRSTTENDPLQVSGHPAWIVKFVMTYPTAASQGLPWQAELGAVVVVDRGTGQAPAVLYVAVPDNLGMSNVDVVLQSLQLAAPPAATAPAGAPASAPVAGASPPAGGNPPSGANP